MVDITEESVFEPVPLIEVGQQVKGGVDGPANIPLIALTNRTKYLKDQFESLIVNGLNLIGTLNSFAELDSIPTENLKKGDAYFVEGSISVWNLEEWVNSGSLLGPRGITLLGTWPSGNALPEPTANTVGDAFIWRSDIWLLIPAGDGTPPEEGQEPPPPLWTSIGLQGPEGQSAYQAAVEDGFQGTKPQWLASLVGKNNYQLWLDAGNTGTLNDFLATLKSTEPGPPGDPGPARAPFEVMGGKADETDLPTPGTAAEAWYVGSHLYVWVTTENQYVDLGSVGGLSAYELAVEDGFSGTLQQWLASLKSTEPGPKGDRGQNLNVKGTVPLPSDLNTINNPQEQDGYVTASTGNLWIRIDGAWSDVGPFRGQSTYQLWLDSGNTGSSAEFLASLKGTNGKDGVNIVVKGSVATFVALTPTPEEQDVYSVRDTNTLYAYVGGAWVPLGQFKGADGEDGAPGANGSSIDVIKVLTPQDPTVPSAVDNVGKAYIDLDKRIQLSVGGIWYDAGAVGATGDRGAQGTGINLRGTVPGVTYLPLPSEVDDGDGYFTGNDKMLYVLTDGQWAGPFDITGLQGIQGIQGIQGKDGASINILGAYPTLAALSSAVPTGNLGDGYLVGNNLAIWSTADGGGWIDIGLVRGPQGVQGVPGPEGVGKKGDKGDKGSSWITLPAGVDEPSSGFTGNIGDWAISDTFKVFYKSAQAGWQYWGRLVAGDVNSPLLSAGKVVRLGNEWVPLLVDEAPNMIDGKAYVRQLIGGSLTNEGEWVELVFPDQIEEPTANGKKYVRTVATGQTTGTWSELPSIIPEAPDDGKLYGRKNPTGNGDGDALWMEIPAGTPDVTVADGKIYGRSLAVDGVTYLWKEIIIPAGTVSDLVAGQKDGKYYCRVWETNGSAPYWKEVVVPAAGIGEAPTTAGKTYLRRGDTAAWVEYIAGVAFPAGGNDSKTYVFKNGAWIEFNRYDLNILALSATGSVDPLTYGFVLLTNSAATSKTITLGDGPKSPARAMTLVVKVNGAAGVITFAPTGATPLVWNGGTPPTITGSRTILTFLWDGAEWTGGQGSVVP